MRRFASHFTKLGLLMIATVPMLLGSMAGLAKETPTVQIDNAWVRPTNAGQSVGAAYMTLTSKEALELVAVTSDLTESVEIHSMTMDNGVMKMRKLNALSLKANEPYALAPGGFHLMLFDLKKPLLVGEKVHFNLQFNTKTNASFSLAIEAIVKEPEDANTHQHH
jgi:copper(I)-binding protein